MKIQELITKLKKNAKLEAKGKKVEAISVTAQISGKVEKKVKYGDGQKAVILPVEITKAPVCKDLLKMENVTAMFTVKNSEGTKKKAPKKGDEVNIYLSYYEDERYGPQVHFQIGGQAPETNFDKMMSLLNGEKKTKKIKISNPS